MTTFKTRIVTPEACALDAEVNSLMVPGVNGFFGVLAHHAPMIAAVGGGTLKVSTDSGDTFYSVGKGVLEVTHGGVLILTDQAAVGQIRN
jgi:F-type H+-transporting ATPase subunit epsilon